MRTRLLVALALVVVVGIAIAIVRVMQGGTNAPTVGEATPSLAPATAPPAPGATAAPSPAASESAPLATPAQLAAVSPAPPASPTLPPSPTPLPSPTANPNLLLLSNGAFVARWTVHSSGAGAPQVLANGQGWVVDPAFTGAPQVVFELPARATLDSLQVDAETPDARPATIDISIGDGVDNLHDAGTLTLTPGTDPHRSAKLALNGQARFVRLTFHRPSGARFVVDDVIATGREEALPPARFDGYWTRTHLYDDEIVPGTRGSVPNDVPKSAYWVPLVTATFGSNATASVCIGETSEYGTHDGPRGDFGGRNTLFVVHGGRVLVGYWDDQAVLAVRIPTSALCVHQSVGKGPALAVITRAGNDPGKFANADALAKLPYRHVFTPLGLFDAHTLAGVRTATLLDLCNADAELAPWQAKTMLDWVAAGGVLIVRDSDACSASSYAFLPYPFKTFPTGARGLRGQFLTIADPSQLGAGLEDPAHFIDTKAYLAYRNDIGDADVMKTTDPHWCGLMLTRNGVDALGWVHAYARYGRGLLIFNGFDEDDIAIYGALNAAAVTRLEYAVSPRADLPCNAKVAEALALWPSTTLRVPAGRATTVRVPLSLAHLESTAATRVTLTIAAAADRWPVRVEPNSVTLAGVKEAHVTAVIAVPARMQGSLHTFTVTATEASGASARATLSIESSMSLAKQLEGSRRARIYGIHFDVASATIQPRSEPVIAQIADVLRQHSDWRMRVEGHTDSDGGEAYNQTLSEQRAQSVVNDLVTRYHINRSRLVAVGYGLTRPVASNATEAGKALNRRVELVRL